MSEASHSTIFQFGTSRFLQAHADFFIGQALREGKAAGAITVVQTTSSPDSAARVEALRRPGIGNCRKTSSPGCARTVSGPTRWSIASSRSRFITSDQGHGGW